MTIGTALVIIAVICAGTVLALALLVVGVAYAAYRLDEKDAAEHNRIKVTPRNLL